MAHHNVLDTTFKELHAMEWGDQIDTLFAMANAILDEEDEYAWEQEMQDIWCYFPLTALILEKKRGGGGGVEYNMKNL